MITQAHVSQLALKCVLAALAQHPDDVDIQAKGLVVLGVLGQVHPHCKPKCTFCTVCCAVTKLLQSDTVYVMRATVVLCKVLLNLTA